MKLKNYNDKNSENMNFSKMSFNNDFIFKKKIPSTIFWSIRRTIYIVMSIILMEVCIYIKV